MINKINILGVQVADTDISKTTQFVQQAIKDQTKAYICFATASTLVDCQNNSAYRDIINNAGMVVPDGIPLVWMGRIKGSHTIQRTCGPDFLPEFCRISQDMGYRHFFFGGVEDTLKQLMANLKTKYPALQIAGYYSPGLRKVGQMEEAKLVDQMNSTKADVLWVGLGSPKQDIWMANHRSLLNIPILFGVGAAFDFLSGQKKRAPNWMKRCGLEWFYRLCSEPQRLWKRYLLGNIKFIYYLIKKELLKYG
ncbi:MAG: WecB/TagA/CpsF family glycosyltransferase [Candidatus Omnitrophica bacterium]|nr:WecB/TagA/CpsF family glycosyltransferase [Candidatus Omnitrophota bacterium]